MPEWTAEGGQWAEMPPGTASMQGIIFLSPIFLSGYTDGEIRAIFDRVRRGDQPGEADICYRNAAAYFLGSARKRRRR
jgi:hypothetical protein